MQIEQYPIFRKSTVPWYDSSPACVFAAVAMAAIFIFAVIGFRAAATFDSDLWLIWLPALLAVLSASVFVSLLARMIRRNKERG